MVIYFWGYILIPLKSWADSHFKFTLLANNFNRG